jgi:hypothetical protein
MLYHADSGLYLTQYRAYDPRTARWLSRDPLGEFLEGRPSRLTTRFTGLPGYAREDFSPPPKRLSRPSYMTNSMSQYQLLELIGRLPPSLRLFSPNLYAYVGGNPVNRVDPLGLYLTPMCSPPPLSPPPEPPPPPPPPPEGPPWWETNPWWEWPDDFTG